jgi:hypothetical protein
MAWNVVGVRSGDRTRHVVPVRDLIAHEIAETCPCGPRSEGLFCPDGMVAWVVLHHPLDGRREYLDEVVNGRDEAA